MHLATDSVIQVADVTPLSTSYVMFILFFTQYITIRIVVIGLLNCHHMWSSNVIALNCVYLILGCSNREKETLFSAV